MKRETQVLTRASQAGEPTVEGHCPVWGQLGSMLAAVRERREWKGVEN